MADSSPQRAQPRGLPLFGAAALVLVFLIALGATVAIAARGGDRPPTELAARVPAGVELYVGLDMDLASDRWMRLEELLDHLGVLERVIDERDDVFAEEGIDFDGEVMPVLTEIEHAAFVAELSSDGDDLEPKFAFLIETRDEDGLRALLQRLLLEDEPRTEVEESVDEQLGLAISEYLGPRDSGAPELVVASRDGVVYLAEDADYVRSLVRRADEGETLDQVPEFGLLADESAGNSLVFAFVDTREPVQALAGQLETLITLFDAPGAASPALGSLGQLEETPRYLASSFSAQEDGFAWELLVLVDPDQDLPEALVASADVEAAAGATPAEARLFIAAAELGALIDEQLVLAREEGGASAEALREGLEEFRELTGVDLERDLLPRLSDTFAISVGVRSLRLEEPDFALFLTGSDDHGALADDLERLRGAVERECDCDAGVVIGEHGGFSFVGWPESRIERRLESPETLGESARFRDTLGMLRGDPLVLLYLDLGFVFDELLESGDLPVDEVNPDAIRGLGLSSSRDGELLRFNIAVPIEAVR